MSSVSAPRTSPTTMRSGRMRSDSRTRSRNVTAPSPSRFGWRHCIATTSGRSTRSSKTSSQVTMRSRAGTAASRQLSSVVLPAPTAPATTIESPAVTAGVEEARRGGRARAEVDELGARVRAQSDELPDVHRPVVRDRWDRDVQAAAVGEAGIDERLGTVEPSTGARQHALHDLLDVARVEDETGELVLSVPSDEHPTGLVDPDLLDLGVLHHRRQGAEPDDPLPERLHVVVAERRQPAVEVAIPVVGDDLVDERPQRVVLVREAARAGSTARARRPRRDRAQPIVAVT